MSDIPRDFYQYDTQKPFETCIQCGLSLHEHDMPYMVERSIRRYPDLNSIDVIYEYAMCLSCVEKQKEFISEDSMKNMEDYFKQNMQAERMSSSFINNAETGRCAVYGTPVTEMTEYVLQATFMGQKLYPGVHPMIFGENVIMELSELISAKTRDEMDNFIDTHFSGPPEWRELLRERKRVLI